MNNLNSLNFSMVFHKVQLSRKELLDNELLHTSNFINDFKMHVYKEN